MGGTPSPVLSGGLEVLGDSLLAGGGAVPEGPGLASCMLGDGRDSSQAGRGGAALAPRGWASFREEERLGALA